MESPESMIRWGSLTGRSSASFWGSPVSALVVAQYPTAPTISSTRAMAPPTRNGPGRRWNLLICVVGCLPRVRSAGAAPGSFLGCPRGWDVHRFGGGPVRPGQGDRGYGAAATDRPDLGISRG